MMRRLLLLLPLLGLAACSSSPAPVPPACTGVAVLDLPVVTRIISNAVSVNGTTGGVRELMTPVQMGVLWKDAGQLRFLAIGATGDLQSAMSLEALVFTQVSASPNGTTTNTQAVTAVNAYRAITVSCGQ